MEIIKHGTNIDFLGKRKQAFIFSAALLLIGLVAFIARGGFNLGLDFTGGAQVEVNFQEPVEISEIRAILGTINLGNSVIKEFGSPNEILIATEQIDEIGNVSDAIMGALRQHFEGNTITLNRNESVGPRIGSELKKNAVYSVTVALFLLIIYISVRFQFMFAIAAIAALVHDVLITLGIFSVFDKEITLSIIAAILTIVGYSLNDTIVVSDRIRENLKLLRKESFNSIINRSLNQTLSRTVITSMTTLMVVVILYIYGGEILKNFAFALIIGVSIGTYSSIFIATPIVVSYHDWQENKKKLR